MYILDGQNFRMASTSACCHATTTHVNRADNVYNFTRLATIYSDNKLLHNMKRTNTRTHTLGKTTVVDRTASPFAMTYVLVLGRCPIHAE